MTKEKRSALYDSLVYEFEQAIERAQLPEDILIISGEDKYLQVDFGIVRLTIESPDYFHKGYQVYVNWGAIGNVGRERTEKFAFQLSWCADMMITAEQIIKNAGGRVLKVK